jgi:hypothetical protein
MVTEHFPMNKKECESANCACGASSNFCRNYPFDLASIGAFLKSSREMGSLDHKTVADGLLVKKSTVHAIETGRWQDLPHSLYVKGYVRSYARFLGVSEKVEDLLMPFQEPAGNESLYASQRNSGHKWSSAVRLFYRRVSELGSKPLFRHAVVACSTLAGVVFGAILFFTFQVSSVSLKDVAAVCHFAMVDVRKAFLS